MPGDTGTHGRERLTIMAMKPYPSNLIIFDMANEGFDEELKLDLVRSWTHVGEILVRTHTTSEGETPKNVIHIKVKYGARPYLAADGGESDANWAERMEQHILSTMRKVSNNLIAHNRRRRREGLAEIPFASMEFELERGAVTFEFLLDSNGAVPTECAHMATHIRAALAAGTLGQAVRVVAPSPEAYSEQAAQAAEERRAREEAEAAAAAEKAAAEEAARQEAEAQAQERFMESPELVQAEQEREDAAAQDGADEAAESEDGKAGEAEGEEDPYDRRVSPLEVPPLSREEWDALYGTREADFAVDYHLWRVVYADGSTREFDSQAEAFVA